MTGQGIKAPATFTVGALAATAVIALAALSAVLTVVASHGTCSGATPSGTAKRAVPANYLRLYRLASHDSGVPWTVLAAIGAIETDHGRSRAPGVRSGLNRHGCCAGPMQFNTRDGPPSTWEHYGTDGNHDGTTNIYDPADAIPSAAAYLSELARRAHGNLDQAILGYNHSPAYVRDVLARARAYARASDEQLATTIGEPTNATACGELAVATGPANLRAAERVAAPRSYRALPPWARAAPNEPAVIDARLYDDAVWILRRYHLHVSAAREAATTPTATAPPSTSSPPTGTRRRSGTAPRVPSPATSAGRARVRAQVPALLAASPPRSSSSATTATPTTARRAPARGMPRAPAPLLGLALLRHRPPLRALSMGDGIRGPAGRLLRRQAAGTVGPPRSATPAPWRAPTRL